MQVLSVNAGRPRLLTYAGGTYSSAINKQPIEGPVEINELGVTTDRQADKSVHGGPELALCVFAEEHYHYFQERLGVEIAAPAFGENLTTQGLLETEVCVGDRFRIGSTVIVQVSQPREPCSNLAKKHGTPAIVRWIVETGYCGFYLRVQQCGTIQALDQIELLDRPNPHLPIAKSMQAMMIEKPNQQIVESLIACNELSPGWRKRIAKRQTED